MAPLSRWFPWLAVAAAVACLVVVALPPPDPDGQARVREFGKLPIVYQGRLKPFDTLARSALMTISGRQTFVDEQEREQPAIAWLLGVMTGAVQPNPAAERQKVFRIENEDVLGLLGLEKRAGLRYAIDEFRDKLEAVDHEANRARALDAERRSLFDVKVLELAEKLHLYTLLARWIEPRAVPPPTGESLDAWQSLYDAALAAKRTGRDNAGARDIGGVVLAYAEGRTADFNDKVAAYRRTLAGRFPEESAAAGFETWFNHFAPFYRCSALLVCVALLCFLAWLGWSRPLNGAALRLVVLTWVVYAVALVMRMHLQGRPPVTNLYSSAVFIGWVGILIAVVLEWIFRNSVGTLLAALIGFPALVVSHNLDTGGDTMEVLQAVLDTNFWLATHVTSVTIGYASTFVAGLLGIILIVRGVLTPSLDPEMFRTLGRMVYGVLCFATFFSFTGTVLGGIWADQSWGRFWGWDVKENGALIIVLWNALILHARWGGMVRERGTAVLSVFGNIVTSWSWFGVNMLGVGLHSYGRMDAAVFWLLTFVCGQLAIMAVGLLPIRLWRSPIARPDRAAVSPLPPPAPAAGTAPAHG